jgi:hypothetical protein
MWGRLDLIPKDRRVMREGDFHPTQHDPTVMSISVNELLSGCNRILLDQTQKNCTSLHRQCTAISISSTKNSFFAVYCPPYMSEVVWQPSPQQIKL